MNFDIKPYLAHLRRMIIIAFMIGALLGFMAGFIFNLVLK